jgi:nitrate/nitrite-specific signal transduction histidine kinase
MIEQITAKRQRTPPKPLSKKTIAIIRMVYDAIVLILAFASIFSANSSTAHLMGIDAMVLYTIVCGLILLGSISSFFLIRSEKTTLGMNVLIYSLVIGMFINSIYIERVGSFGLITTIFLTVLVVSQGFEFRKGILPTSITLVFGIIGLAFDTLLAGAEFRSPPPLGMTAIWVPTVIFSLLVIYILSRQFSVFSLRAKLISSFIIATVLSLTLLILFNMITFQKILTDEADESLFAAASQTSDSIEGSLRSFTRTIETLSSLPRIVEYASNPESIQLEEIEVLINAWSNQHGNFLSYSLLDINGKVIADSDPEKVGGIEPDMNAYINSLWPVEISASPMTYDPEINKSTIVFDSPIVNESLSILGMLRVQFDANFLQEKVAQSNGVLGEDSFAVLFDEHFIHLAHGTHPETIFTTVTPLDTEDFEQLKAENRLPDRSEEELFLDLADLQQNLTLAQNTPGEAVYFNATDVATGERSNRVAVIEVSDTPWLLAFFQPRDIFLQPLSSLGDVSIFLFIIAGVFATGIGLFLTQVIVKPISNLNETASRITEGDFTSRVEIQSNDEIGTLSNTFNMMAIQLQSLFGNLENKVSERTRELQNQTAQLKAAAEIARDAITEEELSHLLDRASFLMCDRFGFYHVGVYLIDARGHYAVLSSSGDPQGKQLVDAEHKYLINTESIVGLVCALGKPRTASSSDQDTKLVQHPLLPNTQSQLTLPLRASGKTIGAIDIQSTNPRGFTSEEVDIFSTFSDQIATAIEKTEYREEIQETLNELETAYGQFTQEAWRRFLQGEREKYAGYRYQQLNVEPVERHPEEVIRAWDQGEVISKQVSVDGTSTMAIPMKVRGEVIGVLDIQFDSEHVPPDTQNLMTEIADRLSLVLENARLIETAQTQVEREQLATHITDKIRQSLDLDTVLRTATQEIGESLGLAEVEVRLGSVDSSLQMSDNGGISATAPPGSQPPVDPDQDYQDMNEDSNEYLS